MKYRSVSKRQRSLKKTVLLFAVFLSCSCTYGSTGADVSLPRFNPGRLEKDIAKITTKLVRKQHYNQKKLDDKFSETLYAEYFKRLDPNHFYFLKADLDEFSSVNYLLDDYLSVGNVDFAFTVYRRFLQRIEDRVEFARKTVNEKFDFGIDEEITFLYTSKLN